MWHSMNIEFSHMNVGESLICPYFGDVTGVSFSFVSVSRCGSPLHFYYLCYQILGAQPAPQVRSGYSSSRKQFKESKNYKRKA